MGIISTLGQSIDNSQLLRQLHQQIEHNNVNIQCRDRLDDQLDDIAHYIGDDEYLAVVKSKRIINLLSGILALPFLLIAIVLSATRLDKRFSTNISQFSDSMFDLIFINYGFVIVYSCILILVILYFYFLKKKNEKLAGNLVNNFIAKITKR